jgi:SAM-dependent methyltransferase
VFDPPHILKSPDSSFLVKTYGKLHPENWQDDLRKGFAECFRVLKPDGVLIFKWSSVQIPLADILKLTPHKPLFGHPTGRKHSNTHWVTFMKNA